MGLACGIQPVRLGNIMVPKRKRGRPRKIRRGDQEVPQPACPGPIINGHKREDVEHRGTRNQSVKRRVRPNRKYWNGKRSVEVEEDNVSSAGDRTEEILSSPAGCGQITSLLKPASKAVDVTEGFRTEPRSESQSCMVHLQISSPELGGPQIEKKKAGRSPVEVGVTAEDKMTAIRRPPTVILKKFQELLKHRHPKTRKTDEVKKKQGSKSDNDVGTIEEELVKLSEKCNGKESTEGIFLSLDGSHMANVNTTDENHNEIIRPAKSSKQSEDKTLATSEKKKRLHEEREAMTGMLENLKGMMALPLEMNTATVEITIMEDPKLVPKKQNKEYGENTNPKSKTRQLPTLSEITKMTKRGEREMGFRGEREKNSKEKRRLEDRCVIEKEMKGSMDVDISSEELDVVGDIQGRHIYTAIEDVSGKEEMDVGVDEVSLEKEHPSAQPNAEACVASESTRQEDTEGFKATMGCLTPNPIFLSQKNKMTLPDHQTQSKENPSSKNSCRVTPGSTGSSDPEEEVEVDILVCSPCAQPIVWEEGLTVPEFTTEEEMEEEENEIDVTGYQTD
ncbi:ABC transporter F family member 4-like [Osmerus eperlanus]|uniref:ABC transporter F family member 4-like n=1 Tax=Osmerus eperlanus TaxID=29151 RepID=UPI002E13BD68